jgi:hypothetical protein
MPSRERDDAKPISTVVAEIVQITERVVANWDDGGCAPDDAAKLLRESRLDRILSLSFTLNLWTSGTTARAQRDGMLILAWANLGSLVEGWLKLFLCIYLSDYQHSVSSKRAESIFKRLWEESKAQAKDADGLTLESLREFCRAEIWATSSDTKNWDSWCRHIQERRNAIHAFKDRELGSFEEFQSDIRIFREFLDEITFRLPDCPDRGDGP